MNPYSGVTFAGFFVQLWSRLLAFCSGRLTVQELVPDEVQLLTLIFLSVSAGIVGAFLVLRRLSMLANTLSHTMLLGIVVAFLLTRPMLGGEGALLDLRTALIAAMITGVATAFITEFLHRSMRLQVDAANGFVFTAFFALGVTLITAFTRNAHISTEVVMGNVDALHPDDLQLAFWVMIGNLVLCSFFFRQYKITTFDAGLAKAIGISPTFFNYLLMIQVSATAVAAFRAVGVVMVLALLVGLPLIARRWTARLKTLLICASLSGIVLSLIGVALARHLLSVYQLPLSTGGLLVSLIVLAYALTLCASAWRQRLQRSATKR